MRKLIYFLLPLILIRPAFSQIELDKLKLITFSQWKMINITSQSTEFFLVKKPINSSVLTKGLVDISLLNNSNKKWQTNFSTNDDVKMSLTTLAVSRPFVLVNAMGNNLFDQRSALFPSQENKLINNNWTVRGILGIDSRPLFNNFIAGLGVGAAVINQNLNNNIMFSNLSAIENSQLSIRPSVLASATWLACPTCIAGHGGSISLQVAADQYSEDNFSLQPGINQKWQLSEMLVFNLHI